MPSLLRNLLLPALLLVSATLSATDADNPWKPLFDGKSLKNWKVTDFGGGDDITVKDGILTIPFGYPLNGLTWDKKNFPTSNYEISLQARRIDGNDFFCGLTFPINDAHASLILGGWGGTVVGLSSIDRFDASENETASFIDFQQNQWYTILLRVEAEHVQVWLDEKQIIDVKGKKNWSTRPEVDASKPLGIATFQTVAEIRNFNWRPLVPAANKNDHETKAKSP